MRVACTIALTLFLWIALAATAVSCFSVVPLQPHTHAVRLATKTSGNQAARNRRRAQAKGLEKISMARGNQQDGKKISEKRRAELGIPEGADEYNLEEALNNNTDPFITKVIAGSLILVLGSLLVVGVIIPITADYGEGVCNPLLTAGRC